MSSPSSTQDWNSNPQPLKHESSPITTIAPALLKNLFMTLHPGEVNFFTEPGDFVEADFEDGLGALKNASTIKQFLL